MESSALNPKAASPRGVMRKSSATSEFDSLRGLFCLRAHSPNGDELGGELSRGSFVKGDPVIRIERPLDDCIASFDRFDCFNAHLFVIGRTTHRSNEKPIIRTMRDASFSASLKRSTDSRSNSVKQRRITERSTTRNLPRQFTTTRRGTSVSFARHFGTLATLQDKRHRFRRSNKLADRSPHARIETARFNEPTVAAAI